MAAFCNVHYANSLFTQLLLNEYIKKDVRTDEYPKAFRISDTEHVHHPEHQENAGIVKFIYLEDVVNSSL